MLLEWEGIYAEVFIVSLKGFWLSEGDGGFSPLHDGVCPHHFLHRLLRGDPWPSAESEAVGEMDAHTEMEAVGHVEDGVHPFPPLLRQLAGGASVLLAVGGVFDGHEVETVDARFLHRLEVQAYALVAHATIHPVPEGPGADGVCLLASDDEAVGGLGRRVLAGHCQQQGG